MEYGERQHLLRRQGDEVDNQISVLIAGLLTTHDLASYADRNRATVEALSRQVHHFQATVPQDDGEPEDNSDETEM